MLAIHSGREREKARIVCSCSTKSLCKCNSVQGNGSKGVALAIEIMSNFVSKHLALVHSCERAARVVLCLRL